MTSEEAYRQWLLAPGLDADTRAELAAIESDPAQIEERFYRALEFGTAGLRGVLGAGTNRMNRYVVRQAAKGLSNVVCAASGGSARGVCVAYDSRRFSREFAEDTACVLAAAGVRCYLFSTLHSVPQLSFALQELCCIAGVVITASHNPPKYNGFKVYWEHGGQTSPEQSAEIFAEIQKTPMFSVPLMDYEAAVADGMIVPLGEDADERYYRACLTLLTDPDCLQRHGAELKLVYTPLHGTGNVPVRTLLSRAGVTNVTVVPEQEKPDPDFPTVAAPNPENPNAFDLARRLAEANGATVCIATDPDADRLGVCAKSATGQWATLTGNQIGCLLLEHILSARKGAGTLPENGVVVKSLVSTHLAEAIAARYGVACEDILTGFRFISEKIDEYARSGEKTFLFGFEESFGFLAGGLSRDKDAISSALLLCELCVELMREGKTLYDALLALYARYGFYKERVESYTREGKAGMERIAAAMAALRANPPSRIGGVDTARAEDYASGMGLAGGEAYALTLPRSDMLRYVLENGAWVIVRPSGTEPKLKLYIGARESGEAAVDTLLNRLYEDVNARILALLD